MEMKWNMDSVLISILLCCVILYARGQTVQNAKDLRTQLFTTDAYDYRVRPTTDQSQTINISIEYSLLNLNELDEVEEVLKTTGYLSMYWIDSELTWTSTDYGGIESTFIPQDEVWKPDVVLKNSYTDHKQLGTSNLNVAISSSGDISWYPFQVFISTCSIDITFYPFDVQTCQLQFVAWSYGKDEVHLRSYGKGIDLIGYEPNPTWDLLDTSFSEEIISLDAAITFTLKVKRKPLYTIISVVFPILMLAVLNMFVFVLPCESGEKSGYAVTVFLAFAVFLTIVEATMPENSTSVALFSIYIILMTAQSTVITMIALIMLRCSTFNEEVTAIPKWLITLANIGKYKPCRGRRSVNKVGKVDAGASEEIEERKKKHLDGGIVMEKKSTWKQVINGVDAFCFMLFTIFDILITVLFLGICSGAS